MLDVMCKWPFEIRQRIMSLFTHALLPPFIYPFGTSISFPSLFLNPFSSIPRLHLLEILTLSCYSACPLVCASHHMSKLQPFHSDGIA